VKITDGGQSRQVVMNGIDPADKRNWSTPVVMDPNNSNVLYYGTNRIYQTEDGAQLWNSISPDLSRQLENEKIGTVTTIAVAPSNSDVIYTGMDDGLVWVSKNYGQDWEDISDSLPFRWVTRVVVHPDSDNIAYVTFSGLRWKDPQPHVFRTTDFGNSWQDISSNLPDVPVNAFAIDPKYPSVLYLGSDVGAFISMNDGEDWSVLGEGLPLVVINDMKIQDSTYTLVVGTHGRSMYTLDLNQVTGLKDLPSKKEHLAKFELQQNYPNPFNPVTSIEYQVAMQSQVELNIYNLLGQKVVTLVSEKQSAGIYKYEWDASNLPSGIYIYRLTTGHYSLSKRAILLK